MNPLGFNTELLHWGLKEPKEQKVLSSCFWPSWMQSGLGWSAPVSGTNDPEEVSL